MLKKSLLTASLALVSTSAIAEDRNLFFSGISFSNDSSYFYAGGVNSPFSSIKNDGVVLRSSVARGSYDYKRPGSTLVEAGSKSIDALVGYQLFNISSIKRLTVYAGVDHQDHELDVVDLANRVQGGDTGAKGILETVVKLDDKFELDITGSYSGAFNTYYSKTQIAYGCDCGSAKFGPEFIALGSKSFDQKRYGAFINNVSIGKSVKGNAALGFAESARRGDDGMYAEIGFSFLF